MIRPTPTPIEPIRVPLIVVEDATYREAKAPTSVMIPMPDVGSKISLWQRAKILTLLILRSKQFSELLEVFRYGAIVKMGLQFFIGGRSGADFKEEITKASAHEKNLSPEFQTLTTMYAQKKGYGAYIVIVGALLDLLSHATEIKFPPGLSEGLVVVGFALYYAFSRKQGEASKDAKQP